MALVALCFMQFHAHIKTWHSRMFRAVNLDHDMFNDIKWHKMTGGGEGDVVGNHLKKRVLPEICRDFCWAKFLLSGMRSPKWKFRRRRRRRRRTTRLFFMGSPGEVGEHTEDYKDEQNMCNIFMVVLNKIHTMLKNWGYVSIKRCEGQSGVRRTYWKSCEESISLW